jgi:hypothetical protein
MTSARFETATTAVDVARSVEFNWVEVMLIRKDEGVVPEYPLFVTTVDMMHHFGLDAALEERSPETLAEVQATKGLGEEQIEAGLTVSAKALEQYAADILQGAFSLVAQSGAKVRAYLHEHPEVMTVYAPADLPRSASRRSNERQATQAGKRRLSSATINHPRRDARSGQEIRSSCNHEQS